MSDTFCLRCGHRLSNHLPQSICEGGYPKDMFLLHSNSIGMTASGSRENDLLFFAAFPIDLMSLKQRDPLSLNYGGEVFVSVSSVSKAPISSTEGDEDFCFFCSVSPMDMLCLFRDGFNAGEVRGTSSFLQIVNSNPIVNEIFSKCKCHSDPWPNYAITEAFATVQPSDHFNCCKVPEIESSVQLCNGAAPDVCTCDTVNNTLAKIDERPLKSTRRKNSKLSLASTGPSSVRWPHAHEADRRNLCTKDRVFRDDISRQSAHSTFGEPARAPLRCHIGKWDTFSKLSASSISVLRAVLFLVLISVTCQQTDATTKAAIHAIVPHHIEIKSALSREFRSTVVNFKRDRRNSRLRNVFSVREDLTFLMHDTPTEIIDMFCKHVIEEQAVAIININNPLRIRRRTSSNQYVLRLARYLGIPVISWDTEFSGSVQMEPDYRTIQLAPTIQHQAQAIVSLLERFNWTQFSIVTSAVAGDSEFVSAMEMLVEKSQKQAAKNNGKSLELLSRLHIANYSEAKQRLMEFVHSDSRVFLLHCSARASYAIMGAATALGLTGREYVWILTRTSIPTGRYAPKSFPVGLMGVSFDHGIEAMKQVVKVAMKTWLYALLDMAQKPAVVKGLDFPPQLSCETEDRQFWTDGGVLYQYMLNTTIRDEPHIKLNRNGTIQRTELTILNLQWEDGLKRHTRWREVGRWKRYGLKMEDITWPGEASIPPSGRPKRAFLRVATLYELPYVVYRNTTDEGVCEEKSLPCYIYKRDSKKKLLQKEPILKCCAGLSMDLLKILGDELNFDVRIEEVKDAAWGGRPNGTWNGLVKALLEDECDMVVTSFKINPERASAIEFSVPYLETGIKIIVALRDGAISPTAFLEPFDYYSWCMIVLLSVNVMGVVIFLFELFLTRDPSINFKGEEPYDYASWSLILIFSVHATGSSILIFEWLSPYGLNRGQTPMREHKFSLFRSFWLIWAMLFSTSVQTDSPRGIASRFLANIWALFALVFLASYTANLAAFMITKEEYYKLSGIQDYRLQNPYVMNPPFKYATTPNGSTEAMLRTNYIEMYKYMRSYNQPDVDAGINALKAGHIQAFIYDSSVLEYYASRDPKCRLVTVGNRYAMTGYGIGFPPNPSNPWIAKVNRVLLKLQENGELDRLQKFWLAGACDVKKETGISNRTLGILNFTSAFILLGTGILLGLLLLSLEHVYFMFGRKQLRKWDKCGCCALVSLSMGRSLRMKDYVDEAMSLVAKNRCKDPICETQMWKLKHKLDLALLKIENLESQLSDAPEETSSRRLRSIIADENAICLPNHKPDGSVQTGPDNYYINSVGNHNSKRLRNPLVHTKPNATVAKPFKTKTIPEVTFANERNGDSCCIHENPCPTDDYGKFIQNLKLDALNRRGQELDPTSNRVWPSDLNASPGNQDCDEKCDECIALNLLEDADSECDSTQSTGTTSLGANISGKVSPWPGLKRSPSYTSAIGGSFGSDTDSSRSPNVNRYRQYDGKTYMGVGGVTL